MNAHPMENSMKSRLTKLLPLPVLFLAAHAFATDFAFDQSASQLTFTGSYDGEPIDGKFEKFSGTLKLDFTNPKDAAFDVTIAVASLNTDYQDRDDTLRGDAWFDVAKFPSARFVSSGSCAITASKLNCPGTFTLHGVSKTLGLAIEVDAKTQTLLGSAAINRHDFGVGSGEWDESGVIGDTVKVEFRLGGLKAK